MLHRIAVVLLIALEAPLISSAPLTIHRGEPTLLNFEPTEAKSLQHERPVATTTLPTVDANNFTCPGELIEVTVPPGTAPRGSECVFPFEYHGTNYTQCTPVDNAGVAWCYTNLTSGLYGNCVCRLPQGLDAPAEPYGSPERTYEDAICDVGGPACMGYCVIPVTHGGCPSALQPLMSNCTDYNFMMDNCTLREGLWDEATQSPTLPRCDAAGDGELCEGLGECGTNSTLNNCGAFGQAPYYRSIYRKVPRSWTSHRPQPRPPRSESSATCGQTTPSLSGSPANTSVISSRVSAPSPSTTRGPCAGTPAVLDDDGLSADSASA